MTADVLTARDALDAGGPLAEQIPNFTPRPTQQAMAAAIEEVLAERRIYIAESGTGTGKTFAYLVPALLSGRKVLISSGTRNLQDQLYHRDLPLVRKALALPVSVALLKGRANYLCRYRLQRTESEGRFASRADAADFVRLRDWAGRTRSGDIAEADGVAEDSTLWPLVTSTADNCLGAECPNYDECFVNQARREALAADVLVVNHHLFFADLALREEGFGRLLPGVDAVIFDEAHQLPDIASHFFGMALSSHQAVGLARDAVVEELREHSGVQALRPAAEALEKAVADMRLALGASVRREPWERVEGETAFRTALEALHSCLSELNTALDAAAAKGQGLASCARRATELLDRLTLIIDGPPSDHVRWFETGARSFSLHMTPLDVAAPFRAQMQALSDETSDPKAWIFTSATLTIGGDFGHFQSQLGLEAADTDRWESPFDYARNSLLYVPKHLPEPSSADYTSRLVDAAVPVIEASRGRAFFLFTSHRALKQASELLAGRTRYPLLIQGSLPRAQLLERFRAAGDAVLLATASFWEGVDVRGPALSCVIIDKLPFAAPDDPVLRARAAAMEEAGRNPFMEYQIPAAVIALKQGAGRLIRDIDDRGVLMIGDPRLYTKSYGRVFLASLPPMPRTRELAEVQRFFADLGANGQDIASTAAREKGMG
ncbi:MAG: ATP-dependent DNA helicase [Gammaproteobacteria bacterium]